MSSDGSNTMLDFSLLHFRQEGSQFSKLLMSKSEVRSSCANMSARSLDPSNDSGYVVYFHRYQVDWHKAEVTAISMNGVHSVSFFSTERVCRQLALCNG